MAAGEIIALVLALSPIVGGAAWLSGWLIAEKIRERRQVRAAIRIAHDARTRRDDGDTRK